MADAPRVLLIGNDTEWAIERSFLRAFTDLDVSASLWDWSQFLDPLPPRIHARRFSWPLVSRLINARLPAQVRSTRADIVLVFKGLLVEPETVFALKDMGRIVTCLNPDNPFNPSPSSSQPQLRRALASWDCYFTWSKLLVERLYSIGARRVEYLPFAWDPNRHPPGELSSEPKYPLSFVGSYSRHREAWLSSLLDLDLHIWGGGWHRAASAVRGRVHGGVQTGPDFARVVRDSVVSLNILDPWNVPGHNMRTFEIPGCGGLELCTASSEVADLLEPAKEILLFRTVEDLRQHVSWALAHPTESRAIARAGHDRVARETFSARAKGVLEVCRDMSAK
jgi:spore maturation protein CgeB